MGKLKIYDGFETKSAAQKQANQLKKQGVQFAQVRKMTSKRLKYGVFLGGKNSSMYV